MQICIFCFNTLLCCFLKSVPQFCANHCNPSLNVSFSYSLSYFFLLLSSDFPIQMVSSNASKSSKISSELQWPENFYSSFKSEEHLDLKKSASLDCMCSRSSYNSWISTGAWFEWWAIFLRPTYFWLGNLTCNLL